MNICKKKNRICAPAFKTIQFLRAKYKVSVCDAGGILRHIDAPEQCQLRQAALSAAADER